MAAPLKVVLVFGTRPEAIKMAPVQRVLAGSPDLFDCRVCVTAQHRRMLDQVLAFFDMPVHYDLDIMTPGQGLHEVTERVLGGLRDYLARERPDWVLVHGDTTTTFAAALAAFYAQVAVGHVEAGLRTGQRYSPFPEEMNRRLTGALTTLHFAPTAVSKANLLREGVAPEDIVVTGNTAIDALRLAMDSPRLAALPPAYRAGSRGILVTAHRRENFGPGIRSICRALRRIAGDHPETHIIYPVHPNPNIQGPVGEALGDVANITLLDPVGYERAVRLMADAELILTDSGGIQEEAPSLGTPLLVLRESTERPEGLAAGTARLVGTDEAGIVAAVDELLSDRVAYGRMARAINPYGDGRAVERIAGALLARADGRSGAGEAVEFAPPLA
jgi:UDP-N-acetylglucosamine 2-epimerase (non-hydrolysing)